MELNYKDLGFKAGIEIHQELNTKKLFCNCSTDFLEKKEVVIVKRKMRAASGESGKIDVAASFEQGRERVFEYHGYLGEFCLVDLDEEPPHNVDKDALDIALGIAKVLKLKVPDTICVMRKTISDGSATSGFQRTILLGVGSNDSYLETSKGNVKIEQLNLEEDSCKIIGKKDNVVKYSLSRLGIPLVELGTDASLKDPSHVKEAALAIGSLLRSFNVKRGLGTIRQDVNISIKEGDRVEIKGWQDIKKVEDLVKNEVLRQHNLIEIKKELKKKGLKKFEKNFSDVSDVFKNTDSKIISNLIKSGGSVFGLVLPKFSGFLKREIMPGKTFGRELSEYAKSFGTKGMIHTDEDISNYGLTKEFNELKKKFKTDNEDLIVIIAEKENIVLKAIDAVYNRANYALVGIPRETRVPNHNDATNSYARPLAGAHRLYPETDVETIKITKKILEEVPVPELIKDKIKRFSKEYGVSEVLAKELIDIDSFEDIVKKYKKTDPSFLAKVIVEIPKEIKKRYSKEIDPLPYLKDIFQRVETRDISKDAVFEILCDYATKGKTDYSTYKLIPEDEIISVVKKTIEENKNLPIGGIIGKSMEKLRGKADGKKIVEIVKKLLN